jgi:16S rRNA processing protein RimM
MNAAPLLIVAQVARAHGLRGEVSLRLVGDDPARIEAGREMWFEKAGEQARTVRVATSRPGPRGYLVLFEGVETREQAESLAGGELSVAFDPADLASGEFYAHQLEGLGVETVGGEPLGRVTGVVFAPGRVFLEVAGAEARRQALLIPFHGDIVKEVDLAGGRVIVDPPEGLLEL